MVPQDEVSSDPLSRIYDLAANIYLTVPEDKKALHDLRNMIMLELAPKHVQSQISASVRTAIMHAVTEADPYQALLAVFKATRHEPSWKEATAA